MTTPPSTASRKRRARPAAGLPPLDDPGRLTPKATGPKATAPADPGIPPAFAPNTSFAPNT
jgi:hypothetical protein